jgi:hypothetical protein
MAERRLPRGLLDPESQAIAEAYEAIPSVRRQTRGLLSLDPQEDQSMMQTAIEAALGFIPGVGQLLAGRDIERARRAGDPAAAAMAATEFLPFGRAMSAMRRAPTANVAESEVPNLVDLFNRQAKREVDLTNQRLERTSGAGEYMTFSPAQSLSDIDNDMSYAGLSSKANLLEQIGKDQGFKTKVEGSSKSGSQYVKFYKELDGGEIDFKIRVSDHPDVSRFSPIYEKKALDLNPESTESISNAIDFLRDQNKVKRFYEEF